MLSFHRLMFKAPLNSLYSVLGQAVVTAVLPFYVQTCGSNPMIPGKICHVTGDQDFRISCACGLCEMCDL